MAKIKGCCSYCNEEMDLVAADKKTGANWVCWQCADTAIDAPFYTVEGEFTQLGQAAYAQQSADREQVA